MIHLTQQMSLHLISHEITTGGTTVSVSGTRVNASRCVIMSTDGVSFERSLGGGDIIFISELGDVRGVPWIAHRDLEGVLRICPIYKWNTITQGILCVVMEEAANKRISADTIYKLIDAWVML